VIVLASRSPQRRALMAVLGVPFRVVISGFPEARGDALGNARGKARDVAARAGVPSGGAVLGADTEVVVDGGALGKPADLDEARQMLRGLSGRAHVVRSAVALITEGGEQSALDATQVRFRPLPPAALDWYLASGEWRDRAGAYAIQGRGAALVESVRGDYTTVVGLPLGALIGLLVESGLGPWTGAPAPPAPAR
jgi:septum formation protein